MVVVTETLSEKPEGLKDYFNNEGAVAWQDGRI